MATIIDFPKKSHFIEKIGAELNLSEEVKGCLSEAYDEVTSQIKNPPSLNIREAISNPQLIEQFNRDYHALLVDLMKRLLVTKVNVCLLRQGKNLMWD